MTLSAHTKTLYTQLQALSKAAPRALYTREKITLRLKSVAHASAHEKITFEAGVNEVKQSLQSLADTLRQTQALGGLESLEVGCEMGGNLVLKINGLDTRIDTTKEISMRRRLSRILNLAREADVTSTLQSPYWMVVRKINMGMTPALTSGTEVPSSKNMGTHSFQLRESQTLLRANSARDAIFLYCAIHNGDTASHRAYLAFELHDPFAK